jgi:hypothetical protein
MMGKTVGKLALFLFWVLSMTWLVTTKIFPDLGPDTVPDAAYIDDDSDSMAMSSRWDIYANRRRIGRAETLAERQLDGSTHVQSVLHVDSVPLERLFHQVLGPWRRLVSSPESIPKNSNISFETQTEMTINSDGQLEHFTLHVSMDGAAELITVEGTREATQLVVRVASRSQHDAEPVKLLSTSFALPENGLTTDDFSPSPRLANLSLGQTWRFESYQAFPPGRALRLTQANVQREELIIWNGDVETVYVVSYRDISNKGPTASSHPYSHLWVRDDGTVLKQKVIVSSLQLEFHRLPDDQRNSWTP